ncbi:unnamed protein product [Vitrella brassicaformis CCMP3155]|uniref:Uncharacterized protein n=4 Tax=Vitrella brassicaformis TaxID=1169539 RepID=A0A0G4EP18_VITBC|nr:unnamed protein product [Vitrella brassicaformis CCMP3155]|eukprot:CEL98548.1 unnamed protein product [Vitrella brassicaformis CCMP3155]
MALFGASSGYMSCGETCASSSSARSHEPCISEVCLVAPDLLLARMAPAHLPLVLRSKKAWDKWEPLLRLLSCTGRIEPPIRITEEDLKANPIPLQQLEEGGADEDDVTTAVQTELLRTKIGPVLWPLVHTRKKGKGRKKNRHTADAHHQQQLPVAECRPDKLFSTAVTHTISTRKDCQSLKCTRRGEILIKSRPSTNDNATRRKVFAELERRLGKPIPVADGSSGVWMVGQRGDFWLVCAQAMQGYGGSIRVSLINIFDARAFARASDETKGDPHVRYRQEGRGLARRLESMSPPLPGPILGVYESVEALLRDQQALFNTRASHMRFWAQRQSNKAPRPSDAPFVSSPSVSESKGTPEDPPTTPYSQAPSSTPHSSSRPPPAEQPQPPEPTTTVRKPSDDMDVASVQTNPHAPHRSHSASRLPDMPASLSPPHCDRRGGSVSSLCVAEGKWRQKVMEDDQDATYRWLALRVLSHTVDGEEAMERLRETIEKLGDEQRAHPVTVLKALFPEYSPSDPHRLTHYLCLMNLLAVDAQVEFPSPCLQRVAEHLQEALDYLRIVCTTFHPSHEKEIHARVDAYYQLYGRNPRDDIIIDDDDPEEREREGEGEDEDVDQPPPFDSMTVSRSWHLIRDAVGLSFEVRIADPFSQPLYATGTTRETLRLPLRSRRHAHSSPLLVREREGVCESPVSSVQADGEESPSPPPGDVMPRGRRVDTRPPFGIAVEPLTDEHVVANRAPSPRQERPSVPTMPVVDEHRAPADVESPVPPPPPQYGFWSPPPITVMSVRHQPPIQEPSQQPVPPPLAPPAPSAAEREGEEDEDSGESEIMKAFLRESAALRAARAARRAQGIPEPHERFGAPSQPPPQPQQETPRPATAPCASAAPSSGSHRGAGFDAHVRSRDDVGQPSDSHSWQGESQEPARPPIPHPATIAPFYRPPPPSTHREVFTGAHPLQLMDGEMGYVDDTLSMTSERRDGGYVELEVIHHDHVHHHGAYDDQPSVDDGYGHEYEPSVTEDGYADDVHGHLHGDEGTVEQHEADVTYYGADQEESHHEEEANHYHPHHHMAAAAAATAGGEPSYGEPWGRGDESEFRSSFPPSHVYMDWPQPPGSPPDAHEQQHHHIEGQEGEEPYQDYDYADNESRSSSSGGSSSSRRCHSLPDILEEALEDTLSSNGQNDHQHPSGARSDVFCIDKQTQTSPIPLPVTPPAVTHKQQATTTSPPSPFIGGEEGEEGDDGELPNLDLDECIADESEGNVSDEVGSDYQSLLAPEELSLDVPDERRSDAGSDASWSLPVIPWSRPKVHDASSPDERSVRVPSEEGETASERSLGNRQQHQEGEDTGRATGAMSEESSEFFFLLLGR